MSRVQITDVVLRDGHQSLIATRLRTEDMLPVCAALDRIGFWSLEVWGGATFDSCLRFLKEDPWERLRKLRRALPNSRLQMLLRGQNLVGYRHYSDSVVRAFVQKSADNGIDVFRIFDALNDLRNLRVAIEAVNAADKHAQGAISYTVSPVHSIEQFVAMARELEAMGCHSIAIKDMAGIMTPQAATQLVGALVKAVGVPIQVHSHATAGLASMSQLKAVEAGATLLDTCISAFAEGPSHPTTESIVAALQGTAFDTGLDLAKLEEVAEYFRLVRKKYWQFEAGVSGVDPRVLLHQVPGGMISNLINQLKEQGALERLDEVLAEIPRVRADLGYPPLVTPTSQIVGTQAVINVMTGKRYQSVTKEVKQYLLGHYGAAPGVVDDQVRRSAVGDEVPISCRPADLLPDEFDRLRSESEAFAASEEDLLTYAMYPELAENFLRERAAGTLAPEPLLPPGFAASGPARTAPTDFNVTVHGETYNVRVTGSGHPGSGLRPYYVYIDGMPEEVMVETLGETGLSTAATGTLRPRPAHAGHLTTPMPGVIVAVNCQPGDQVKAGDPLLVVEAMKMENEIQASVTGTVIAVHVHKGDSVHPDESLLEIQPA